MTGGEALFFEQPPSQSQGGPWNDVEGAKVGIEAEAIMRNILTILCGACLSVVLVSCGDRSGTAGMDDPGMQKAISQARDSVDGFIQKMKSPDLTRQYASVKVKLTEGDKSECIWLSELQFRDGNFYGKIASAPQILNKWLIGDTIAVLPEEIIDWIYVGGETRLGGFTLLRQQDP